MPRTVRCTCAVRGSTKVSVSPSALATMSDFSSGVRYRWCGSLPVAMRAVSVQVTGSMTLTLASRELRTNKGGTAACTPCRKNQNPPRSAETRASGKIFTTALCSTQANSVALRCPAIGQMHGENSSIQALPKCKNPPVNQDWGVLVGGADKWCLTMTYFHTGSRTIIGAKSFHCPVRDGKEWGQLAMVIRRNWEGAGLREGGGTGAPAFIGSGDQLGSSIA